jgi:glutaredoxin 3
MPDVIIYTTASCPYCLRAKALLREKNLPFKEIAVDGDPEARREMALRAHGRKTVPQIFFDGAHIGDCDELYELDRQGRLDTLLAEILR